MTHIQSHSATVGLALLLILPCCCWGQRYFATALGGISTLSADDATQLGSINAVSLYKPENGPALNVGGGIHLNDWFSFQGNYIWNSNDLKITEIAGENSLVENRSSSQWSIIADLLVYFRPRRSRIRPYLSAGTGVVHLHSNGGSPLYDPAIPILPPASVDTFKLPLRVAVGIDLLFAHGWGARYSFSETISGNPFSAELSPPGTRALKNFQNLLGFVKYF